MSIKGIPIGGPPAIPDFNQTDGTAGDYIKNKPNMKEYLRLDGGTMTGKLNVIEPKGSSNAATKKYVDDTKEKAVQEANRYSDGKRMSCVVTLKKAGWENNQQRVEVKGVTADETKTDVMASPEPKEWDSREAYMENNVYIVEQQDGAVVFTCDSAPECDVTVNVAVAFTGENSASYPDGDEVAYG